jgi:hypothetical protein
MHTLKPRPATPRGWSGGSTAIYFFAGGGRFGASADIGANRSERKKTQDDKCCASHISTGRALCGRSLRHPPRSPMRDKPTFCWCSVCSRSICSRTQQTNFGGAAIFTKPVIGSGKNGRNLNRLFAVACLNNRDAGLSRRLLIQLSLPQKILAFAAVNFQRCSGFQQTSRSAVSIPPGFKSPFRRGQSK